MIPRPDVLIGNLTHVGMERSENQDYYGYYEPEDDRDFELQGRLIIVCDGMGGHAGGEVASRLAVNTIIEVYRQDRSGNVADALRRAIEAANRAVWDHATQKPELKGMGSTCVSMVIRKGMATFGHVGDSRVYLIRNEQLIQVTRDHSLVQQMVDEGLLQESEMESHPEKNVILRSLGVKPEVEVEINQMPYQVNDIFLLSTDGLTGLVSKEECRRITLLNKDNPMEGARLLVDLANKYGGYDNITVQIARIMAMSPAEAPKVAKPDSNTALFTQEDVQRSIAEARAKAAAAAKAGPSAAEMMGNVQKKGQGAVGVTTAMAAPSKEELEKARQEVEARKAAQAAAGGTAAAPRAPAAAPQAASSGKGGGSNKMMAVALAVVITFVIAFFGVNALTGGVARARDNLKAAMAKIPLSAQSKPEVQTWTKRANDALDASYSPLGFLKKGDLEECTKKFEEFAAKFGQSTSTGGSVAGDGSQHAMDDARARAAAAGAPQLATPEWERAEAAKAAGKLTEAAEAYERAARGARQAKGEKDLAEIRLKIGKEKEEAQKYARDYFPELWEEAQRLLGEAEKIEKTDAERAAELAGFALDMLRGANRFALEFEKKN